MVDVKRDKLLKMKGQAWRRYYQKERFTHKLKILCESAVYQEDVLNSYLSEEKMIDRSVGEPRKSSCGRILEKIG